MVKKSCEYPLFLCCILCWAMNCPVGATAQALAQKEVLKLMGSRFEITAVSEDEKQGKEAIQLAIKEIQRIERAISSWEKNSETSTINRNAGIRPTKVSKELFQLIHRSLKVSQLTEGAFDITYAIMDGLWRFDGSMEAPPPHEKITAALSRVNYGNVILDFSAQTVFLKEEGMKIGFGAIGKGYAANRGKSVMQEAGVSSGLINAGGDLLAWGKQADHKDWRVGIADPQNKQEVFSWLPISDLSVVTSGDYEKFFDHKGLRYGHIIDPRSGYPARGLKSVTIICPDAELGDALATAVFVLGEDKGLDLVNRLRQVECVLVNEQNELISSENLKLNYYKK